MRPASRFLAKIGSRLFWPAVTGLPFCAALATDAFAQTPMTYTVPANTMPWMSSDSLNSDRPFGAGDGAAPVVVHVSGAQGQTITIQYQPPGGVAVKPADDCPVDTITAGSGFPCVDANGDTSGPVDGGYGASGKLFPSAYMMPYPINLTELVGTFADSTGEIVGIPFAIGDAALPLPVPPGATQLQLGVNDDIFSDNSGSWTVSVDVPGCASGASICFNKMNIAGGDSQPVVIGQKITLDASPSSGTWDYPSSGLGTPIGNFLVSNCSGLLVNCQSQVTAPDFSKPHVEFYWYVPGDYQVSFSYLSSDGNEQKLNASFHVVGPPNAVLTSLSKVQKFFKGDQPFMGLGNPNQQFLGEGIKFLGEPSLSNSGTNEWVQLLRQYSVRHYRVTGSPLPSHVNLGLDTQYPYPSFPGYPYLTGDHPNVKLCEADRSVIASEAFSMYLLWKSTDPTIVSIFVPVKRIDWGWEGVADHNPDGSWEVLPGRKFANKSTPASDPMTDFPVWNKVAMAPTGEAQCQ